MLNLDGKKLPLKLAADQQEDCAARAGALFDLGFNCAQAVLQASTRRSDPELLAQAKGFCGGIGDTGCLCGAIVGGVMVLGLADKAERSKHLMANFKETFRTPCCRGLSHE